MAVFDCFLDGHGNKLNSFTFAPVIKPETILVQLEKDRQYMSRCLQLARMGEGNVAPNPMVGAVLVYQDRIIGEGYHEKYGQAHAEPNCIKRAIQSGYEELIKDSTLYVSLEPCAHQGKTPPCADFIIQHRIPKVVVGCRDPFPLVAGRGIEKLRGAGVELEVGILEKECAELNKRFFCFHQHHRPYVILKWAETADGFIAPLDQANGHRLAISNDYTNRLVHRWRTEEAAILVGTQTALADNPTLTTRLWPGNNALRVVLDMDLKLPLDLRLFDQQIPTIVFNTKKHEEAGNLSYYQLNKDANLVAQVMTALYQRGVLSVMIEGGARTLQSFIDAEGWDEARVIRNTSMFIKKGIPAAELKNEYKEQENKLLTDTIEIFYRNE